MKNIIYPDEDIIVELNAIAITIFEIKKADKSELLSYKKLSKAIEKCKEEQGDLYNKAAVLMMELIKAHPFASGNRRTALIAVLDFMSKNKVKVRITNDEKNARVLQGIREDFYSKNEIMEWIKNGNIREFKR